MPIYEYRCANCQHTFEAFQRLGADGSGLTCPMCGTPNPEKLFSAFAQSGAAGSGLSSSSACSSSAGFS